MSERLLTPWQLEALRDHAEFGDLTSKTTSKRQARILTSLYSVQRNGRGTHEIHYCNIETIIDLIEVFFDKKYTEDEIAYWVEDLIKRDYVRLLDPSVPLEENFVSISVRGLEFYNMLHNNPDGRKLFESRLCSSEHFIN